MIVFANRSQAVILLAVALMIAIVALTVLGLQLSSEPVLTASWRRGG